MATTTDRARELTHAHQLLVDERYGDAVQVVERFLRGDPEPRQRVEGLTLRLIGLMRIGRTAELTAALEQAFEASRAAPDLSTVGELHALAALVAFRLGSLDRCATHLVRAGRALGSIELTNETTAWAWHDLAMAYSETGFHGHALAAIDHARQVASSIGLPSVDFAAPGIRLRQAVSLDHRGDTDGCQRVLRDVLVDLEHRTRSGQLDDTRPSGLGAYGYALARFAAFGDRNGDLAGQAALREQARDLLDRAGDAVRSLDLRTLGLVCLAIAETRPVEAVARLETAEVSAETLGAAEVHRLRALAHLAAGDHESAYRADRHAFRVASTQFDRVRELFVEAVAARLDSEELRRTVAGLADQRTDSLTGLPGRDQLEQHIAAILGRGEPLLIGICDLDNFVAINTVHGSDSGDLVLQRIAGVLNRVMRRGDFIARAGGDEFALVLPAAARPEVKEIGRRILTAVIEEDWDALVPGTRVGLTVGWADVDEQRPFGSPGEAIDAAMAAVARDRLQRR